MTGTTYCVRCDRPQPCVCYPLSHSWRAVEYVAGDARTLISVRDTGERGWHWIVRHARSMRGNRLVIAHGYALTEVRAKRAARHALRDALRAQREAA